MHSMLGNLHILSHLILKRWENRSTEKFSNLFNEYLFIAYYVPIIAPRTGERTVNKKSPNLPETRVVNWPQTIGLQSSRVGTETEQCRSGGEIFANSEQLIL